LRAIKNKDGSMPDNARAVFNRLIAEEMDPEMASQYAGLPLQISKTEAEIMERFPTNRTAKCNGYAEARVSNCSGSTNVCKW
jgi:hypothetical protein